MCNTVRIKVKKDTSYPFTVIVYYKQGWTDWLMLSWSYGFFLHRKGYVKQFLGVKLDDLEKVSYYDVTIKREATGRYTLQKNGRISLRETAYTSESIISYMCRDGFKKALPHIEKQFPDLPSVSFAVDILVKKVKPSRRHTRIWYSKKR